MLLENIALGKTVEIYVDRDGYRYRLISKVEQTGTRRLCVTAIAANGKAFLFRPEDDVKLVYRDEEQMWEWPKVKAGLAKLDGEPVHYFDITNKGHSFNRRNAYRVSIDADLEIGYYIDPKTNARISLVPLVEEEYEVSPEDEEQVAQAFGNIKIEHLQELSEHAEIEMKEEHDIENMVKKEIRIRKVPMKDAKPQMVKSFVKDISETGVGFYSNYVFQVGDGFFVEIPSPYGKLMTRATVVRISEVSEVSRRYKYYYGCVYTESPQKLIRYIYDLQRKMIQKRREQQEFQNSRHHSSTHNNQDHKEGNSKE